MCALGMFLPACCLQLQWLLSSDRVYTHTGGYNVPIYYKHSACTGLSFLGMDGAARQPVVKSPDGVQTRLEFADGVQLGFRLLLACQTRAYRLLP